MRRILPLPLPNRFVANAFAALLVGALLTPSLMTAQTAAVRKDAALGKVSEAAITRHVAHLASDKLQGRRAGTTGADEAAKYLAAEFRKYGLKPLAKSGFLVPFDFVSGVKLGSHNKLQVRHSVAKSAIGLALRSLQTGKDFMPLAFSASQAVSGEVMFAGYGISAPELQYDNYAGVEARGKIALILRGSPDGDNPHGRFADYTAPGMEIQKKVIKAREKGASAVIFISEAAKFSDDRLTRLRHDLNFLDAGIPAIVVSRAVAANFLQAANLSVEAASKRANENAAPVLLKETRVQVQTDVVKVNGRAANVIGMIEGSDPQLKNEYVVIGAHYDHLGLGGGESLAANPEGQIHHGADDNASGTAAILELARVMTADRARLKRSVILMAFSAEEVGLLGSAAYTKNPLVPLASTVAMLNLDMVGRLRNGALTVGGVGTSPVWKPLLERLNVSENGSGSRFQLAVNQDGFGPSDHQSFYVKNVPVLFFFTGTHDDYHKPSDTADKVNSEGTRQIAEFVRDISLHVAAEAERLAFTRVQSETPNQGRRGGFRVYIGTVPNYADSNDGLKLDGVRPASPAEKAGLQAGDVVIRIAQMSIKNVYDYTAALGELKGGEEVEVVVRRDGQEIKVKLTPERRQ